MRGLTSTIALVVVLAGLVGYIYFVDRDRPPGGTETKPKVFDVSSEDIEEVHVKNAAGDTTRLRRNGTDWQIIDPREAEADAGTVSSVTSSLAALEVQRVVDENPADLEQYGLSSPRLDVAFRATDQKDLQRLLVGELTPSGGDLYARKPPDSRVFLISSYLDATFDKTTFDFRDKAILKFERDKADGIELVGGPTALRLSRNGTDWRIVKPIAGRADYGAAEGLVSRLSSAQMRNIVAEDATDLKPYGLDRPSLTASVTSGSSRATLLLGKSGDQGLFAKDASRPVVFTVEESLATELGKDVAEFRRKDLVDSRSFTANRVELRRGDETVTFEETKDADGTEVWRNAAGQNADADKVEELLTKLSSLRAQAFESSPHPSLKTPVLTATIRFDDSKTETVTFGRTGSDVFGARADEAGAARLDAKAFDEAIAALDAVK